MWLSRASLPITLPPARFLLLRCLVAALRFLYPRLYSFRRCNFKFKSAHDDPSRVMKWWFVLRGEESMLEQLQKEWSIVALQTSWKLEPVLCYVDNPDEPKECDNEAAANFAHVVEKNWWQIAQFWKQWEWDCPWVNQPCSRKPTVFPSKWPFFFRGTLTTQEHSLEGVSCLNNNIISAHNQCTAESTLVRDNSNSHCSSNQPNPSILILYFNPLKTNLRAQLNYT